MTDENRVAASTGLSPLATLASPATEAQAEDDGCGCGHDHDHAHHHGHHHAPIVTYARGAPKVGRNDICPCGSGKKYKKCCLEA